MFVRIWVSWCTIQCSLLRVQGSGFRDHGSRFRVQKSGFRVQGSRLRVRGSGFGVEGSPRHLEETLGSEKKRKSLV